jgi:hypothetical protein
MFFFKEMQFATVEDELEDVASKNNTEIVTNVAHFGLFRVGRNIMYELKSKNANNCSIRVLIE